MSKESRTISVVHVMKNFFHFKIKNVFSQVVLNNILFHKEVFWDALLKMGFPDLIEKREKMCQRCIALQ